MVTNAYCDLELPVYGDGLNVRDWINVEDHCRAIDLILRKGAPGEVYNIGSENELNNLEIVRHILNRLEKPESLIKFVKDRPGHDRRYAMDATKLKEELNWKPLINFAMGMDATIAWYLEHEAWWQRIKSGEYMKYYDEWYGDR